MLNIRQSGATRQPQVFSTAKYTTPSLCCRQSGITYYIPLVTASGSVTIGSYKYSYSAANYPRLAVRYNGTTYYAVNTRTTASKVNSVTRWAVSSPTASVASTTTSGNKTYTYYAQSVTFTATLSCTGTPLADMAIESNSGVWSGTLTSNPDSAVSNGGALSRTVRFTQGTYGTGSASANTVIRVRDRTGNTMVNTNVGQYTYTGSLLRGTVSTEE